MLLLVALLLMELVEEYRASRSFPYGGGEIPPPRDFFSMNENCSTCNTFSPTLHYQDGVWVCRHCYTVPDPSCLMFEYGRENPTDPEGSTAHVRDIKARRLDPKTKTMFYYEQPKTYFFPK